MKGQEAGTPLTLKDAGREAWVSAATRDRVLRNRLGVRPDIVRRVKETVDGGALHPHVAADLACGRTRLFIFVMPSMQEFNARPGNMSGRLSARGGACAACVCKDRAEPERTGKDPDRHRNEEQSAVAHWPFAPLRRAAAEQG